MDDLPRQKLIELIGRYGRDLVSDPRRCEALLRDFCPQHKGQINVLVYAIKELVPAELLGTSAGMPVEVLLSRLTKRLEDNCRCKEKDARWAVESWALALSIVTEADLHAEGISEVLSAAVCSRPGAALSQRSGGLLDLEDVLREPAKFNGRTVQIEGSNIIRWKGNSFLLHQGDHDIRVFYAQLPRQQRAMILWTSQNEQRTTVVEGVLQCAEVNMLFPELIASNVRIQGMEPTAPIPLQDGCVEFVEILLDQLNFHGQAVRVYGNYAGLSYYARNRMFKLMQGDHGMWVHYSQLPKEQKSMIRRESKLYGHSVIVEGILDCADGSLGLTASKVVIEGVAPRKSGAEKTARGTMPAWNGCGPCSKCRTIINMRFDGGAWCPICGHLMNSQEVFRICGSYCGTLPKDVYSERDLQ